MKLDDANYEMTAKTLFGLEDVLVEELRRIDAKDIVKLNRAVSFKGNKKTMYRANLELRTALRIYKPIHKFRVRNENELYKRTREFDWEGFLNKNTTIAIDSTVNSTNFNHENYVALKVKDAIVDKIRAKFGARPNVDTDNPDYRLHVHISREDCTLSLDSSGNSLHKRGYRISQIHAPMNEVLAAGLIMLSGWDAQSNFVDPMCGSGTLIMEAATFAYNIAPNFLIKHFGFMNWADMDIELWNEIKEEANNRERDFGYKIFGLDESPKAIKITKENIKNSGLDWKVLIKLRKFEKIREDDIEGNSGVVIINPPYGERLREDDIINLYSKIGDSLKQVFTGFNAWVISSNKEAMKHIGLKASRRLTLFNGSLECKFHKFEIYEGTRKKKWLITSNSDDTIIP